MRMRALQRLLAVGLMVCDEPGQRIPLRTFAARKSGRIGCGATFITVDGMTWIML
jgi:hypothetical protein